MGQALPTPAAGNVPVQQKVVDVQMHTKTTIVRLWGLMRANGRLEVIRRRFVETWGSIWAATFTISYTIYHYQLKAVREQPG